MIRRHSFILTLGGLFLLLAAVTYAVHYAIFKDVHHILIYGVGDLAFLPLEVLIVVLVIEKILARREKQAMLQKLNMVVGVFFMESGNYLLRDLLKYFKNRAEISGHLNVDNNRTKKDFKNAAAFALHLKAEVDYLNIDFPGLKAYLAGKREFLLTLLENPALLEHDLFTDLLWATTHLDEELEARASFEGLPEHDLRHIAGDIQRLYDHLASEWLDYIEHLKGKYPYLYSLVLRTHPFQKNPSPIVT